MLKYKFITLLILITVTSFAQNGSYYLYNYDLSSQNIASTNTGIAQGHEDFMYFANTKGVLQYNGITWNLIETGWPVTVVKYDSISGRIYVGCNGNFGFIKKDDFGKYSYLSLSNTNDSIGKTEKILTENKRIIFYSPKMIVAITRDDNKTLNSWIPNDNEYFTGIFNFNNHTYVNNYKNGLFKLTEKNLEDISQNTLNNTSILSAIPLNKKEIMLALGNNQVILFNGTEFSNFIYESHEYVEANLLSGILINDQNIILSTLSGGCLVLDKNTGKKKGLINYQSGLPDDEIRAMQIDNYGGLWICHGYGISRADMGLPIENFSTFVGIEGNLTTLIMKNNNLYVASNEGLYILKEVKRFEEVDHLIRKENKKTTFTKSFRTIKTVSKSLKITFVNETDSAPIVKEIPFSIEVPMDSVATSTVQEFTSKKVRKQYALQSIPYVFKKISGIDGRCKQLIEHEEGILVASNTGLFFVKEALVKKIISDAYINYIYKSELLPGLYYIGTNNGIKIISYHNKEWDTKLEISDINLNVNSIQENEENIWFTCANKVYKIDKNDKTKKIKPYSILKDVSEHITAIKIDEKITFLTSEGFFKLNPETDNFENHGLPANYDHSKLIYNHPDLIWTKKLSSWENIDTNTTVDSNKKAYLSMFKDVTDIYVDNENNIWTISDNSLYKIKNITDQNNNSSFNLSLNYFQDKNKDTLPVNKPLELKYSNNALYIDISPAFYLNEKSIKYSYLLDGLENTWSEWSEKASLFFPYLPSGNYTLHIKAINVFGKESKVKTVKFEVSTPFWQSIWFYLIILIIVIVLVYLIIKIRTKQLKKANEILEAKILEATSEIRAQNEKLEVAYKDIEAKNIHITESIKYAKNIQEAILPRNTAIQDVLDESFIFFKPRDIVSGDFYWFQNTGEVSVIVAADCTGHGVPGAFMSMIGNTLLNQIVKEKGITSPDKILNLLDIEIVKALKQDKTSDSINDGMDISICTLHNNKRKIEFSGAKNHLLMVKNGEVEVVKADRLSIGGLTREGNAKVFTNNVIDISDETCFYILSDGYTDQSGGEKAAKFSSKRLREMLLNIHQNDFNDQLTHISNTLKEWMGENNQRDDILVIGFKISPEK